MTVILETFSVHYIRYQRFSKITICSLKNTFVNNRESTKFDIFLRFILTALESAIDTYLGIFLIRTFKTRCISKCKRLQVP